MRAQAFRAPRALVPGDTIDVIAPSSPFDRASFDAGVARLTERGYRVRYDEMLFATAGYLAGSDERRIAELNRALASDSAAIVAARGGYGATRLLDAIAPPTNKLLVGFSDITALHALFARHHLRSLHGPMIATLGRAPGSTFDRFATSLEGAPPARFEALATLRPGNAEGPLLGGNLAVLTSLLGTPFFPPIDGAILFLEDVSERPYRIDRMMTQLVHAGVFGRVAAVVAGGFTSCAPGPDGVTVQDVLAERLGHAPCPVALGLPCGHVDDNHELMFGAVYRLDAGALTRLD